MCGLPTCAEYIRAFPRIHTLLSPTQRAMTYVCLFSCIHSSALMFPAISCLSLGSPQGEETRERTSVSDGAESSGGEV